MKKVIAYLRKSSEESSKQNMSLDTQDRLTEEYAQDNNLQIICKFKESRSAKLEGNRPYFEEMIRRIEKSDSSIILTCHIDRLTRNLGEANLLDKLVTLGKITEIHTPQRAYTSKQDMIDLIGEYTESIKYVRKMILRVNEGIQSKLKAGEWLGNAPLGYENNLRDHKIYPDPEHAKYITRAFDLYTTGNYSLKQVTEKLYEEGFRSKRAKNKVHKSIIERMLKNPVYYGVLPYKGDIYKGIHEPLIDKGTFDKVQEVFTGKNRSKKQKHEVLYREKLICDYCGCVYTATIIDKPNKNYTYYHCSNGKKEHDRRPAYLTAKDADELFTMVFSGLELDRDIADLSLDLYFEDLQKEQESNSKFNQSIDKQIEIVKTRKKNLLNALLDGLLDNEIYKSTLKNLDDELTLLEDKQRNLKGENLDITFEKLNDIKKRCYTAKEMFISGDDVIRRNLLNEMVSKVSIKDLEMATIGYKWPYARLAEVKDCGDVLEWRRGRDSNPRYPCE